MYKKVTISLPEQLIVELIREAEGHRETFEELIIRKLKYLDFGYTIPEDFHKKKIIKLSIDEITSEATKQEEFDILLTNTLKEYFSKSSEDRKKMGEETLKTIRDAKQKKDEKAVNFNEEIELSIDDITSEATKKEEFNNILNNVIDEYFSNTSEDRIKMEEEILKETQRAKLKNLENEKDK